MLSDDSRILTFDKKWIAVVHTRAYEDFVEHSRVAFRKMLADIVYTQNLSQQFHIEKQ